MEVVWEEGFEVIWFDVIGSFVEVIVKYLDDWFIGYWFWLRLGFDVLIFDYV